MQAQALKLEQSVSELDDFSLEGFLRGDAKDFKAVFDRLYKPLYNFCSKIIDSAADAEDIVSNAFCKLFGMRSGMQSFDHIKRWLYVSVKHMAIDHLRLKTRTHEIAQGLRHLDTTVEQGIDLEMLKSSLLQSLSEAIDKLPRQRKTILQLYFYQHKSTSEIAELLNLQSQTVLNHKTRALEALRKTVLMPGWLLPGVLGILLQITFFLLR
jgi:RNA polymerase sigma-70 factor (family 1)